MEAVALSLLGDFAAGLLEDFLKAILPFILIGVGVFLILVSFIPWFLRLLIAVVCIIVGLILTGWIPGVG
jgi:hypothetical protein